MMRNVRSFARSLCLYLNTRAIYLGICCEYQTSDFWGCFFRNTRYAFCQLTGYRRPQFNHARQPWV